MRNYEGKLESGLFVSNTENWAQYILDLKRSGQSSIIEMQAHNFRVITNNSKTVSSS